ncbi:MAG TPA: cupin domain-containing protein [Actinomycetota bacterium]|nr:cupin domain-containing protein [Actinomycetota bacterium]
MALIPGATAPTFTMPGLAVTGLAAPSRGATQTSVWRLTLDPGADGSEHILDREEVFVVLAGRAVATIDGDEHQLRPGDALVVPPDRPFSLANPHGESFEAVAALPVGGRVHLPGGNPFVPPWAE